MDSVTKGDGVLVDQSRRLCLHMATQRVQTRMNIQCVVGFRITDRNDGMIEDGRPYFFTSECHVNCTGTVHVGCSILLKTREDHKMRWKMGWTFSEKLGCYEFKAGGGF